jgi:glycosyltransferase involved in cell wall biosynthesis
MGVSLSVVLANHNHARFLPDSLGAICGQSLPPREVIVIDDASTDGSVAVIEDFARRFPFVKALRNDTNKGALCSFNRGIAQASGDFVLCPAADDQVLPGLFEKTARLLSRYPEAGLCSTLCRMISEKGDDLGPLHLPVISKTPCFVPPSRFLDLSRRYGNWMMSQTAFYNRKALQEWGGGFDPELGSTADGFLLYVLAARHGACFIPERLGSWRKLDTSFALRTADDLDSCLTLADRLDRKLRGTGLFPEDFLERSLRSTLMAVLYEINRRRPHRFDEMSLLVERLRNKTWTDRAFLTSLGLIKAAGRWASRGYLFLHHPPRERLRIAAEKIKNLLA